MTRHTIVSLLIAGFLATGLPSATRAAERNDAALQEEIVDALRSLEIARLRLRRFDDIEFPLAVRKYETRIKLAQAELDTWKSRLREYETFDRWVGPSGFLLTLDEAKLNIIRLKQGIADLEEEKFLLEKGRTDERRLLRLEAEAAARHLAKLRAQSH